MSCFGQLKKNHICIERGIEAFEASSNKIARYHIQICVCDTEAYLVDWHSSIATEEGSDDSSDDHIECESQDEIGNSVSS